MKKIITVLFLLSFAVPSLAATVGGPEMTVPEQSLWIKDEAVKKALDAYDFYLNPKVNFDIEIITKRRLRSSPADSPNIEMKGQNYMFKFSNNFHNVLEPYVKLGSSNLELKWNQHGPPNGGNVKVETGPAFSWGVGVKAKLWELPKWGVSLTMDAQYRNSDLGIDEAMVGGSELAASASDEKFEINEWQFSLLGSKKFILPIGSKDYYIVPYGGLTFSSLDVDVCFVQTTTNGLFSTYNASDENPYGIVLGCDVMPFYLSYYLLYLELRLVNETAFSLGGTIKF